MSEVVQSVGNISDEELILNTGWKTLTADSYHRLQASYSKNLGLTTAQFKEKYKKIIVREYVAFGDYDRFSFIGEVESLTNNLSTLLDMQVGFPNIYSLTTNDASSERSFAFQLYLHNGSLNVNLYDYYTTQTNAELMVIVTAIPY